MVYLFVPRLRYPAPSNLWIGTLKQSSRSLKIRKWWRQMKKAKAGRKFLSQKFTACNPKTIGIFLSIYARSSVEISIHPSALDHWCTRECSTWRTWSWRWMWRAKKIRLSSFWIDCERFCPHGRLVLFLTRQVWWCYREQWWIWYDV